MEMTLISDTLSTLATKHIYTLSSLTNTIADRHTSSTDHYLQITSLMIPIDAIAPPTIIKPRTAPKRLARKRHRVKKTSKTHGGHHTGDQHQDQDSFFDGGDGPFGGGGGGGYGGGGGGDGGGGFNWDESLPESKADPAFDFVYGVLCWVVFSNCLHFAFKKVMRIVSVTDGVSGTERSKVRFTTIC